MSKLVELQVLKSTPATIEFNDKAIEAHLDELLSKYTNMVFTDETSSDCRKTIAELNKLGKGINKFKIDRKKELIAEVSGFESKCKALIAKVDSVVEPLKVQLDTFDENAKAEKMVKATAYILEAIEAHELEEKFAKQLIPRADATNRSKSVNKMMNDIFEDAKTLKGMQDAEHAKIEMIKAWIELKNVEFELNVKMHYTEFESLVDQELDYIKKRILDTATSRQISEFEAMEKVRKEAEAKAAREVQAKLDAERKLAEEKLAKERAEMEAKAKAEREAEAAKRAEEERVLIEQREKQRKIEEAKLAEERRKIQEEADRKVAEAQAQTAAVVEAVQETVPVESEDKEVTVTLEITATPQKMNALSAYMKRYEIKYNQLKK